MTSTRPGVLTLIDALSGGAGIVALSIIEGTPGLDHLIVVDPFATTFDYGIGERVDALGIRVASACKWDRSHSSRQRSGVTAEPRVLLHHWWKGCQTTNELKTLRQAFPSMRSVLISHNNDPSPPGYDFYVSVSEYNATYQHPHLLWDADGRELNHRIIQNGAANSDVQAREPSGEGASIRVCSLQPFKIRRDWLDFVATIGPPHARHLLIGEGPLLNHFRQAAGRNVSLEMFVPGPVNNSLLVRSMLRTHDVFLEESVKPEAGSLAILEALASGLPVIGDRSGCMSELVVHGASGLLVSSRDEFREATLHLLSNRLLWRQLSAGAIERAKRYTIKNMQECYSDVIEKLICSPRKGGPCV